jgi:imidazolonepropionase-like amidohydrolase
MLLRQAIVEARAPNLVMVHDERLLTPSGRQVLLEFLQGSGPFVFDVDRAADIRQVLALAQREKIRAVIRGGAEAWRVAPELAAAKVAVILDPLENLPYSFDGLGATLENAARLHAAGVTLAFSMRSPEVHDAGRLRQVAANAVAHGLPWPAALAAITRTPAEIFGVADRHGSLARGRVADLVLWSGDPIEVTSHAELVITGGAVQSQVSRHTELRDRYLERVRRGAAR